MGGGGINAPVEDMKRFLTANGINFFGSVTAQGVASCFTCGYGEECKVGAIHGFFGSGTKITEEITPSLCKQQEAVDYARLLGEKLSQHVYDSE